MREVRRDPLTGRQVVISTDRPMVPLRVTPLSTDPASCPFCPGHEHTTSPTIAEEIEAGRWVARAFANRAPGLRVEEELRRRGVGPYDWTSGTGAHEVVVESAVHAPLHTQPAPQLAAALRLARDRLADLSNDVRLAHLTWMRNHGAAAGASQAHPHAQVLGLPEVPQQSVVMRARCERHHADRGRSLLGDMVQADREDPSRLVWEGARTAVIAPWAPSVPFELWIVPLRPGRAFRAAEDSWVDELAEAMHVALVGLARVLGDNAYNGVLHDVPRGAAADVHWPHFRLLPRVVALGAMEVGVGTALHAMPPEEAARLLRG
ncbi:MAG: UDPglucose--hexose-1-phosphate uridylyltransferase [Myxococcota bacterium]|jgi:UDPglucose--hexose-1-phosphate uridylyltransferase